MHSLEVFFAHTDIFPPPDNDPTCLSGTHRLHGVEAVALSALVGIMIGYPLGVFAARYVKGYRTPTEYLTPQGQEFARNTAILMSLLITLATAASELAP